ncbi:uncharacterized protein LOC101900044 [Musca domestica]|uniref:Regulatory protein zeste n=1 Tax=Musca domestica TaxID=7370 RepID=A0A1I8NGT8_MUSDO|nr:uncharacterized protein LOC101900044 [Musca domestica]
MSVKRSRASAKQIQYLVDFMAHNKTFASGKFAILHGKHASNKKWNELATALNGLGGAKKSVARWHIVWRDLKSRISQKYREKKREQALTGNRTLTDDLMTDVELRVVKILGNSCMEDDNLVQENVVVKEEPQLQYIVNEIPQSPSTPIEQDPRETRRSEDKEEVLSKILDIVNKQAESLKNLTECNATNAESIKMMAQAVQTMGEGFKATAESLNNISKALNNMYKFN